jgi:hypothetical protein
VESSQPSNYQPPAGAIVADSSTSSQADQKTDANPAAAAFPGLVATSAAPPAGSVAPAATNGTQPATASSASSADAPKPREPLRLLTNAADILGMDDRRTETVEVPEWGVSVLIRGLTGGEREAWEQSFVSNTGTAKQRTNYNNFRAKLVVKCVLNPTTGGAMFGTEHIIPLSQKNAAALARVYDVAARLSGISKEDAEELSGNSETSPTDAS